jgi:DNA-binding GntR family transcriptional regulator
MDEKTIEEWAKSRYMAERVAAGLARRIRSGRYRKYEQLPPNYGVAREYDVSIATLIRAKRLLAEHDVLEKTGENVYVVAE